MSVTNANIARQPLKLIEVPLIKFREEMVPYHQELYSKHKIKIWKLMSKRDIQQVQQEIKNGKRFVQHLKTLMYELDTLRAQVEDEDLDIFDTKTFPLRKIILTLITGYTDLEKKSYTMENEQNEDPLEENSPFETAPQIQLQESLDVVKLRQRQELLNEVESIHRDTQELHEIFTQLNTMVGTQSEHVDKVEENIENANENLRSGLKELIKAHKLKASVYPVTGAFLGGIIGGPIGLVAGLKVGGLAALGCAIAGYTGGALFKKTQVLEQRQPQNAENVTINEVTVSDEQPGKKQL